jgi:hypothetical protein
MLGGLSMSSEEVQVTRADYADPTEVTGWLLILCFVLMIAHPASGLYNVFSYGVPHLIRAQTLSDGILFGVYSVLFLALAAFSFVAGLRLWFVKPGAVVLARRFLLTYVGAHIAYFLFWMLVSRSNQSLSYAQMGWNHVAGPLLPFAFWYVYLENSKRIRKMYPFG